MTQSSSPNITGRWVLVSTITASSMGFISGSALSVALPAIQKALGADAADLLWINTGYLMLLSSLILVGGSMGDHFGRKRIFGIGIWIFIIASVLSGLAVNVEMMIASRLLQGIGGAMMIPGSLAIISAYFDDQSRGGAIGLWSAFTAITTVSGPVIGGLMVSRGFWRGVFFINVPLAIIALYSLYRYVPESRDENAPEQLDYVGGILATVGLAALTYGFIEAGRSGFILTNILMLVVGVLIAVGFVVWEGRTSSPMMPLGLFRSPVFSGANLLTVFLYAGLQGSLFFFSLNLIQVQNYPEDIAGLAMLPFSILLILMSQRAGAIADRIGPRIPLTVGPIITGIGFALLAVPTITSGPSAYWTTFFPGIVGIGLGMGIAVAPLTTAVMGSVPQQSAGTASGINNAASRTAGVLATAIIGAIVLIQFAGALNVRAESLGLSDDARVELLQGASELGETPIPDSLTTDEQAQAQTAVNLAFVDTFRTASLIGAGLAWLSAIFAWFTLRLRPDESRQLIEKHSTT